MFRNLTEVREHAERWLNDYNEDTLHNALDGLTPVEYQRPKGVVQGRDQYRPIG